MAIKIVNECFDRASQETDNKIVFLPPPPPFITLLKNEYTIIVE